MRNVIPFDGQHCETTATGTLLLQQGINLSEPMLFGIGEGLGFIFWNMKTMDFPFLGGRIKPDAITQNIAKNLQLDLTVKETASKPKAWDNVKALLDLGQVVGLKLDCYHLEYFSHAFHFAAHYVAMYDYDNNFAYLVDTRQQGGKVKTSLTSLALARAEKGAMASKNMYYTINKGTNEYDLSAAILVAIKNNATDYLNPAINNFGYKGILKTSTEILNWFHKSKDIARDFQTTAIMMEKAGTGGAMFRNLYRDFLKESYELLKLDILKTAYEQFVEIANLWSSVSKLFEMTTKTSDFENVKLASDILKSISEKERMAMETLLK